MLKQFNTNYALFSLLLDLGLTNLSLAAAEHLRRTLEWGRQIGPNLHIPWTLYLAVTVIWLAVLVALSVYDPKHTYRVIDELQAIIVAGCFAALVFAGFLYLSYRDVPRLLFVYFAALDIALLLAWRIVARAVFRLLNGRSFPRRRVLIAGAGRVGRRIAEALDEYSWTGLTLVGFLDDDAGKRRDDPRVLGALIDARRVIGAHKVDELVVALPGRAHERLNQLILDVQHVPVNIRVVPDYFSLAVFRATVDDLGDLPLITLREPALNPYQRMVKRAMDLGLGTVALVCALPIMALVAVAIKLDSPGPVIFKQKRVGEGGRLFDMFKFRSMCANAEERLPEVVEETPDGRIIHKKKDDPRVTRVGRFIRATSIDEWPQFFNVLKGEMSLIGPRPELPWLVQHYEPWQYKRLAVPQGITGWWQVNGRADRLMHEHTEDDLYYIQNYSVLLDLQILWRTFGAVLKRAGAY